MCYLEFPVVYLPLRDYIKHSVCGFLRVPPPTSFKGGNAPHALNPLSHIWVKRKMWVFAVILTLSVSIIVMTTQLGDALFVGDESFQLSPPK